MLYKRKFFQYCIAIILILIIINLVGEMGFIVVFFKQAFRLIFIPILIGILFYYILRPIVYFFVKKNVNKSIASFIALLLLILIFALVIVYGSNSIKDGFGKSLYDVFEEVKNSIAIINNKLGNTILGTKLQDKFDIYLNEIPYKIGENISNIVSQIASIGSQIVIIPFIIFYFLKDDTYYAKLFLNIVPVKYRQQLKKLLIDIDKVLSVYITGQLIVAIVIGLLMYGGFLAIKLPNALILSLFAVVTNIIPFLGPFLAVIPALATALTINIWMVIKVLIVAVIAQQIEGNIITPNIIGNKLDINPLIVLFIILIFISLFGFIGAFIAVPIYSVVKITIIDLYKMYKYKNIGKM